MNRLLVCLLLLCSAQAFAGVQLREGYIRELPAGQTTSAAFMEIVNDGDAPVAIIGASAEVAAVAELHTHEHRNGMMRMTQVKRLEIPAHGRIVLAPGGYHLMLINLKRTLRAGDQVDIKLFDEKGRFYAAKIPVVKMVGAEHSHH